MKKFKNDSNITHVKITDYTRLIYPGLKDTSYKHVWFLKEDDKLNTKGTIIAAIKQNDEFVCTDEYKENLKS